MKCCTGGGTLNKLTKLNELREKVDVCDKLLAETLEKRMEIVLEIMQEKKELAVPIFSKEREREIIQRIGEYVTFPEFKEEIKGIHTHVLRSCRRIQSRRLFPYHISIVGFMGSGKTTVGRELSRMIAMDQIDVDKVIEDRTKMTISQIFKDHGEAYFRALEQQTVEELSQYDNIIVFCGGGGIVLDDRNVENMKKNGVVIWLKASPSVIFERISKEGTRPLLKDDMSVGKIEHMLSTRLALYENSADMVIETDNKTVEEVSLEIVEKLMRLSVDRPIKLTE
jgi:shikimate kinase